VTTHADDRPDAEALGRLADALVGGHDSCSLADAAIASRQEVIRFYKPIADAVTRSALTVHDMPDHYNPALETNLTLIGVQGVVERMAEDTAATRAAAERTEQDGHRTFLWTRAAAVFVAVTLIVSVIAIVLR
jgi:hypothetical protein